MLRLVECSGLEMLLCELDSPLESLSPISNRLQIGRQLANVVIGAQLHGRPH